MSTRSLRSRCALWAAVGLLLLKAAVPMLASAAASLQDRPVADICSVYGVALAAPAGDAQPLHESDSHPSASHAGDHCALSALAVLAGVDTPTPVWPAATRAGAAPIAPFESIPDATATWFARMKQGPPPVA